MLYKIPSRKNMSVIANPQDRITHSPAGKQNSIKKNLDNPHEKNYYLLILARHESKSYHHNQSISMLIASASITGLYR